MRANQRKKFAHVDYSSAEAEGAHRLRDGLLIDFDKNSKEKRSKEFEKTRFKLLLLPIRLPILESLISSVDSPFAKILRDQIR